ncbi:MAG: hypothetical protein AAFY98_01335 [Verrucomicrobiota bacterium]
MQVKDNQPFQLFLLLFTLLILFPGVESAECASPMTKDIPWEELSNRDISKDWGKATLEKVHPEDWEHGETEHFIIHYTDDASKIARRAEDIYEEVFEFFDNPKDQFPEHKSHIYAIKEWNDWDQFRNEIAELPWIGGVCRGHEFWFVSRDRYGDFDIDSEILNHEMVHLIFNRIFPTRVPTWLNEGIAEYFGVRKATGKREFRRRMGRNAPMKLRKLFQYTRNYPEEEKERASLYSEAAILVDYLTDDHEPEIMIDLVEKMRNGGDPITVLPELYGFENFEEFEEDYLKHRRRFE